MNGERLSYQAVETAEACEDWYLREVSRYVPARIDAEQRRRHRRNVLANISADRACEGAVRKLRRGTDLPAA